MLRQAWIFYVLFIPVLAIFGCSDKAEIEQFKTTPYLIDIPFPFPTALNIPADNPMTVEGVKLGRYLFYDGRLSGRTHPDSLMSCGTCHIQANSFEAGINHPVFSGGFVHGINGDRTSHVMLPLINLVWNFSGYGWNGFVYPENTNNDFRNIEDIVRVAVLAENELMGDTNHVKPLFQNIEGYPELFQKAFGSQVITFDHIEKAIAQFVRTFVSTNARFDKYIRGELQLTQSELNGYVLFTTEDGADCFHCHGGSANPMFTTHLFYNNGKDLSPDDPFDRYSITGNVNDIGKYKVPTLRNVALTAPYMHDGRYKTLDEVIEFYSSGVQLTPLIDPLMHHAVRGGVQLTTQEKADLMAFILSLQDDSFLTNPDFSAPVKFPDEN
ncbi:MAG: c-type cytochrome [Bacteroidales bacterium]|nr:c-type cytochrome [Bacteroidales bacterium]